jgi:hypothetical protein
MSEMGSSATEAGHARPLRPESGHSITRSTATCQKPAFGCLHSRNDDIRKKLAVGLTSAPRPFAYCIFFTSGHLDSDNG